MSGRGTDRGLRWGLPAVLAAAPSDALAHAADRGHVLLLPTGHYMIGGALAVALTIAVLALVPARPLAQALGSSLSLGTLSRTTARRLHLTASCLSFALLCVMLWLGVEGSRDPLSNPLPLTVWTLFWVGLTLLQGALGNLWGWVEPWTAPATALRRLGTWRLQLPERLGHWPAVVQFLGFAWFELVYPAPDDPARLAMVLGAYYVLNLGLAAIFGPAEWLRRGECLSAFMTMVARLAVLGSREDDGRQIVLRAPGAGLVDAPALPISGVVFLLLALGSVSFDGLMRTFFWLGLTGVNPLEFPGRSAVVGMNSVGLAVTPLVLLAAFLGAVAVGERLAGDADRSFVAAAGRLAWSIIPISLAYHFSHYLVSLVINGQYALAAWSDPLVNGADLFGTAGMHVRAGAMMGAERAWLLWNLQAAAIVGGHLLAVLVAHAIAGRLHGDTRRATLSQLPLGALMVAYTVFGLWLLSSPTAA